MTDYKQTAIKAGIIGAATLGTCAALNGLENSVNDPTIKGIIDLGQSIAATAIPFKMADRYMNGNNDSRIGKYGVQILSMVLGVPQILGDCASLIPIDNVHQTCTNFIEHLKDSAYFYLALGAIPFVNSAKDALNRD